MPHYCVDIIARYGTHDGPLVIIERLGTVKGLALPGGKQEPGEFLSETAVREFFEETGLSLELTAVLGVYAEASRDPRGNYISTAFLGIARGKPCDEMSKTRVMLCSTGDILKRLDAFMFDHGRILSDCFRLHRARGLSQPHFRKVPRTRCAP